MHEIQLSDELYEQAALRARDAGFPNVDDFVTDLVQHAVADTEDLDHLFTPHLVSLLDAAVRQADAGELVSIERVQSPRFPPGHPRGPR